MLIGIFDRSYFVLLQNLFRRILATKTSHFGEIQGFKILETFDRTAVEMGAKTFAKILEEFNLQIATESKDYLVTSFYYIVKEQTHQLVT